MPCLPAWPRSNGKPGSGDPRWQAYRASTLLQAAGRPRGEAFWWRPLPGQDPAPLVADVFARCLAGGHSALVLAPDPGSRLPEATLAVAGQRATDLRAVAPAERCRGFLRCQTGHARLAAGGRSAVFAPLRALGLVVVDDEANPAYKERRRPRHHAREVALARARLSGATCVLIGDLPSARAWRLLEEGHLQRVAADRAVERRQAPRVDVVDLSDPRPGTRRARFTDAAARALSVAVRHGRAAVVLAARGGQGAALGCRGCGRRLACPACGGSLRGASPDHAPPSGGAYGA
ncbi:MAG TPA: hypothetical protein VG452_04580, partial [Egibacteraceae bacterium]|nr:hypothetical protein [Egibacteraceae bacterium]